MIQQQENSLSFRSNQDPSILHRHYRYHPTDEPPSPSSSSSYSYSSFYSSPVSSSSLLHPLEQQQPSTAERTTNSRRVFRGTMDRRLYNREVGIQPYSHRQFHHQYHHHHHQYDDCYEEHPMTQFKRQQRQNRGEDFRRYEEVEDDYRDRHPHLPQRVPWYSKVRTTGAGQLQCRRPSAGPMFLNGSGLPPIELSASPKVAQLVLEEQASNRIADSAACSRTAFLPSSSSSILYAPKHNGDTRHPSFSPRLRSPLSSEDHRHHGLLHPSSDSSSSPASPSSSAFVNRRRFHDTTASYESRAHHRRPPLAVHDAMTPQESCRDDHHPTAHAPMARATKLLSNTVEPKLLRSSASPCEKLQLQCLELQNSRFACTERSNGGDEWTECFGTSQLIANRKTDRGIRKPLNQYDTHSIENLSGSQNGSCHHAIANTFVLNPIKVKLDTKSGTRRRELSSETSVTSHQSLCACLSTDPQRLAGAAGPSSSVEPKKSASSLETPPHHPVPSSNHQPLFIPFAPRWPKALVSTSRRSPSSGSRLLLPRDCPSLGVPRSGSASIDARTDSPTLHAVSTSHPTVSIPSQNSQHSTSQPERLRPSTITDRTSSAMQISEDRDSYDSVSIPRIIRTTHHASDQTDTAPTTQTLLSRALSRSSSDAARDEESRSSGWSVEPGFNQGLGFTPGFKARGLVHEATSVKPAPAVVESIEQDRDETGPRAISAISKPSDWVDGESIDLTVCLSSSSSSSSETGLPLARGGKFHSPEPSSRPQGLTNPVSHISEPSLTNVVSALSHTHVRSMEEEGENKFLATHPVVVKETSPSTLSSLDLHQREGCSVKGKKVSAVTTNRLHPKAPQVVHQQAPASDQSISSLSSPSLEPFGFGRCKRRSHLRVVLSSDSDLNNEEEENPPTPSHTAHRPTAHDSVSNASSRQPTTGLASSLSLPLDSIPKKKRVSTISNRVPLSIPDDQTPAGHTIPTLSLERPIEKEATASESLVRVDRQQLKGSRTVKDKVILKKAARIGPKARKTGWAQPTGGSQPTGGFQSTGGSQPTDGFNLSTCDHSEGKSPDQSRQDAGGDTKGKSSSSSKSNSPTGPPKQRLQVLHTQSISLLPPAPLSYVSQLAPMSETIASPPVLFEKVPVRTSSPSSSSLGQLKPTVVERAKRGRDTMVTPSCDLESQVLGRVDCRLAKRQRVGRRVASRPEKSRSLVARSSSRHVEIIDARSVPSSSSFRLLRQRRKNRIVNVSEDNKEVDQIPIAGMDEQNRRQNDAARSVKEDLTVTTIDTRGRKLDERVMPEAIQKQRPCPLPSPVPTSCCRAPTDDEKIDFSSTRFVKEESCIALSSSAVSNRHGMRGIPNEESVFSSDSSRCPPSYLESSDAVDFSVKTVRRNSRTGVGLSRRGEVQRERERKEVYVKSEASSDPFKEEPSPTTKKGGGGGGSSKAKFSRELCSLYEHIIDTGASAVLFDQERSRLHHHPQGVELPLPIVKERLENNRRPVGEWKQHSVEQRPLARFKKLTRIDQHGRVLTTTVPIETFESTQFAKRIAALPRPPTAVTVVRPTLEGQKKRRVLEGGDQTSADRVRAVSVTKRARVDAVPVRPPTRQQSRERSPTVLPLGRWHCKSADIPHPHDPWYSDSGEEEERDIEASSILDQSKEEELTARQPRKHHRFRDDSIQRQIEQFESVVSGTRAVVVRAERGQRGFITPPSPPPLSSTETQIVLSARRGRDKVRSPRVVHPVSPSRYPHIGTVSFHFPQLYRWPPNEPPPTLAPFQEYRPSTPSRPSTTLEEDAEYVRFRKKFGMQAMVDSFNVGLSEPPTVGYQQLSSMLSLLDPPMAIEDYGISPLDFEPHLMKLPDEIMDQFSSLSESVLDEPASVQSLFGQPVLQRPRFNPDENERPRKDVDLTVTERRDQEFSDRWMPVPSVSNPSGFSPDELRKIAAFRPPSPRTLWMHSMGIY